MILIVGLGNPGLQYAYTRHNAGFIACDYIAKRLGYPDFVNKFESQISEKILEKEKVIIQKPQTFMNLSGIAVQKIVSFFRIPTECIFVIHDDIDLPPYDIRIKFAGSNGGHNGLRSIDSGIGKNYWRIRMGVGRPISKQEVSNYVISKFYNDELQKFCSICEEFADNLKSLIFENPKDQAILKIQSISKN